VLVADCAARAASKKGDFMKRVIICADGTWNIRDQVDEKTKKRRPTNVTKVARAIRPRARDGTDQVVYYHDGVGTGGGLDRVSGGAFGHGMEDNIRELYRFIVYNYEDKDELYFFGFSRGAFTVRSLAGFMRKVGLIQKDDDYYVPEIYDCYESDKGPGSAEWTKAFHHVRDTRPCPPVRFIGVWDTVGALGAPGLIGQLFNRDKYKYHDVGLNDRIENGFHALSIDERRRPFAADIWKRPDTWRGNLEQAWFPGVHSNVGGGYTPDGLDNEALHWIVEKAERLGLEFDNDYLAHFVPCFNSRLADSMTVAYRVLRPQERKLGEHAADGEAVHQAAIDRMNLPACAYAPENLTQYLAGGRAVQKANTGRVPRGTPCPELS
jgi:uncharacterized protein (DUF2235 family)